MVSSRKIRIFIITAVLVALLTTAFLIPVSYSKWSGGGTQATAQTNIGYWGVYIEFPDKDYETIYLTHNKSSSSYEGVLSITAATRVRISVAGTVTAESQPDTEHIELVGDTYTLKTAGSYNVAYSYDKKKLIIGFNERTLDDIFNSNVPSSENDKALIEMLKNNGMTSDLSEGVKGCVTSSGTIVRIDYVSAAANWTAEVHLQKGEKIALFGKRPLNNESTRIDQYANNMNPNDSDKLEKLNSGYFQAKESGTYTFTISYAMLSGFRISGVEFTPDA